VSIESWMSVDGLHSRVTDGSESPWHDRLEELGRLMDRAAVMDGDGMADWHFTVVDAFLSQPRVRAFLLG
jgi:hypothetical protein